MKRKKNKNLELRIYEFLGIKIFRKMAFILMKVLNYPFTIKMSKEQRKNFFNSIINYRMKKGNGLQDLRDFKKMLILNASIHTYALLKLALNVIKIIIGAFSVMSTTLVVTTIIFTIINVYCIMLQRYNWVRINDVLKRHSKTEENKKEILKDELRKEDSLLDEHIYKMTNALKRQKEISFEELLRKADLERLKEYQRHLSHVKNCRYYDSEPYVKQYYDAQLKNGKILRLEFKPINKR